MCGAGLTEAILIADGTGITVLKMDYRMPPKHPFPAAIDDVIAAQPIPFCDRLAGITTGLCRTRAFLLKYVK
jgi:hypothetical protein